MNPQFSPFSHSFNVGIAMSAGVNAAVVFNHIHFWIKINKGKESHTHQEKTWMYESLKEINHHIPYLTPKETRNALDSLVQHGYLVKGNFNKNKFDRTLWYALAEEEWLGDCPKKIITKCPYGQMERPEGANQTAPTGISTLYTDVYTDNKKMEAPAPSLSFLSSEEISKERLVKGLKSTPVRSNVKKEHKVKYQTTHSEDLASFFYERLKSINPKIKLPNLQNWQKEFEKLKGDDAGNTEEEIKKVIEYIISTNENPSSNGFCWANVVLSPKSLRNNFAKIWKESQKQNSQKNSPQKNQDLCKKLAKKFPQLENKKFMLGSDYVEFMGYTNGSGYLSLYDKDFEAKFFNELKKAKIDLEAI